MSVRRAFVVFLYQAVAAEAAHPSLRSAPTFVEITPTPAVGGGCECDAGDYWCAANGYLRRNFNCSGSADGQALWKKLNGERFPTHDDCFALSTSCELQPPALTNNVTCDNECYDFCWKTDVGDCADFDDANAFCVSMCQDYCLAAHCGTRPLQTCEEECGQQFMVNTIDFVQYSMCVATNCTDVPFSPWGGVAEAAPSPAVGGGCECDAADYWCAANGYLRRNFNCSGSAGGRALWQKLNGELFPTHADCFALSTSCELQPPPMTSNVTCDAECYDFCWRTDVGECVNFEDENAFCVSMCQDYCLAAHCGTRPLTTCEQACGEQFMADTIDFVQYSVCVASNCTTVPISPYSSRRAAHKR